MNIGILPNVNLTKQKRDVKPGISVCSRIIRLMNNPKKKLPFPQKNRKRRQKCCVCCEKIVPQLGLCLARPGVIGFFERVDSPGETRCKKSGDQFEEYGSLSLRYVKRVSGKRKDHRMEKYKSKNPHQRSPYVMKFEDRSHEETERQERCARSKAWNSCQKHFQAQREKTRLHSTHPRKNGYSRLHL